MQLSVIILNYNVRFFLEQCLLSVQKSIVGIDAEIIVVDNNSPDDSCEMVKAHFPDVRLIENKENSGFPKGNNIGVNIASGKYVCILNPDTVVAEDTFIKILAFAGKQENLGIIGVKLVDGRGRFLPESKRGVPTPWVAFTKIAGLYKLFPTSKMFNSYYAQHLNAQQTGKVDILVGAFMLMERETYLDVGGFDEDCFMYSDDIDLSYMVLKKGKINLYFHETTVIHYKGESTVKDGAYMQRFKEAMQFFYKKHFRVSPMFDFFMRTGAFFFAFAKKTKSDSVRVPNRYVLFSSDEMLRKQLEYHFQMEVMRFATYNQEIISSYKNAEIVFDNEVFSFSEIISIMEEFSTAENTFKIKPAGKKFLIGSNSSNDRGEIVLLQ